MTPLPQWAAAVVVGAARRPGAALFLARRVTRNRVTKATEEQDGKGKTQEAKSLHTTLAALSRDRDTASTALSAVDVYSAKVEDRCLARPETYEERRARRDAEISGVTQALFVPETRLPSCSV